MLNLKRLEVFREVARQSSFTLAGEELNYSQSAISHHVSSLEREVGAQLLERGCRGEVRLTEVGRVLLAQAEILLEAATRATSEVAHSIVGSDDVRLGMSGGAPIVATATALFRETCTEPGLRVCEGDAAASLSALAAGGLDVAVLALDALAPYPEDDRFAFEPLLNDPMLLVLPERHRLAEAAEIRLSELRDEPWIERGGPDMPWAEMLRAACAGEGFTPAVAVTTANLHTVQLLVATGTGIALLPQLAIHDTHPDVVVRELAPRLSRHIVLASLAGVALTPTVEQLCAALRSAAGRHAALAGDRLAQLVGAAASLPVLAA